MCTGPLKVVRNLVSASLTVVVRSFNRYAQRNRDFRSIKVNKIALLCPRGPTTVSSSKSPMRLH